MKLSENYFETYASELLFLAIAALFVITLLVLFFWYLMKLTKRGNEKIKKAVTMKLPNHIILNNSALHLIGSIFSVAGMMFCIFVYLYIIEPEQFIPTTITLSTVALYTLFTILVSLLVSNILIILNFFTTRIEIENQKIHIRKLFFKNYYIDKKEVLSFKYNRYTNVWFPVGNFKYLDMNGKKHKMYLYLSEDANMLLNRFINENQL